MGLFDDISYSDIVKEYEGFRNPHVIVKISGKDITEKNDLVISGVSIELSSGFEASVASFRIYKIFNVGKGTYLTEDYEKMLYIGLPIEIGLGYGAKIKPVFLGVTTGISFRYEDPEDPYIVVKAMDAKGIMMANKNSRQLTATTIDNAVKEVLDGATYTALANQGVITKIIVEATPDSPAPSVAGAAPPAPPTAPASEKPTIEMVDESDYEFIVRMAKRVNYEFFIHAGNVIFRPAKVDIGTMMTIEPGNILRSFDIEYDITGQVGEVEVRATDTDKGELISSAKGVKNTWSFGNKAANLVKGNKLVYLDPSIHTKAEADMRRDFLIENIGYKFGTLYCETVGVPDLAPGRFIRIGTLGKGADNKFYIQKLRHVMSKKGEYKCVLEGKAMHIKYVAPSIPGLGSLM